MPRTIRTSESPRGAYRSIPMSSTPDMTIIKSETTPSPHLLDHGYGATPINQIMSSVVPSQAPAVKRKLNLESLHYVPPSVVHIDNAFKAPQPKKPRKQIPAKKYTRYDTSLSLLTKKFSDLLERSPNGVVDLNKASLELKVQKRRIYDITNVLEGIGILEKKSKNNIQWKGSHGQNSQCVEFKKQLQNLDNFENYLDQMIESASNELSKLTHDRYGYVTYQDLRSIDSFRNKTVMAIKAPPSTKLSVPAGQGEKYTIKMSSDSGEIDVYLCPESPPVKPKPEKVPCMDMLLRDISPVGLFDLSTPPVPQLDSPTPISSRLCRSLTFKDPFDPGPSTSGTQQNLLNHLQPHHNHPHPHNHQLVSSHDSPSPLVKNENNMVKREVFLHDDVEGLSPMVGRFNFNSTQTEHSSNLGIMDPVLSSELVLLEPLMQPEYNFSLDATEGLADLFDYDFLS
ncbi:unnamed protein product [Diabrotica balteata]|uniref:E2F/DP family winged-helix DNA-binding domain-containing protein n=1 Tax=Diabrotica balteata TaxID=107213 RepID=A0A9P0DXX6_DIABA|nr:unnamed protein product [Diabrotica balteata]